MTGTRRSQKHNSSGSSPSPFSAGCPPLPRRRSPSERSSPSATSRPPAPPTTCRSTSATSPAPRWHRSAARLEDPIDKVVPRKRREFPALSFWRLFRRVAERSFSPQGTRASGVARPSQTGHIAASTAAGGASPRKRKRSGGSIRGDSPSRSMRVTARAPNGAAAVSYVRRSALRTRRLNIIAACQRESPAPPAPLAAPFFAANQPVTLQHHRRASTDGRSLGGTATERQRFNSRLTPVTIRPP